MKNLIKKTALLGVVLVFVLAGCENTGPDEYDAPYNLKVYKIARDKIKLEWTYDSSDTDIVYKIARLEGENNWNNQYYVSDDNSAEFIDDIPTDSYTVYSYKVKAFFNENEDESAFSQVCAYFSPKTKPSDFKIKQPAQNLVELSWKDNAVGESGYKIDKKIGAGEWMKEYAETGVNSVAFTDTVAPGQVLEYRVYAYSGLSNSLTSADNINPSFLAPDSLKLNQISREQIQVKWQSESEGAAGYVIERKIGLKNWNIAGYADQTEFTDFLEIEAGLISYRIRAYTDISETDSLFSGYSDTESVLFNIEKAGSCDIEGEGYDLSLNGNYLYVAAGYSGVIIFDISNQSDIVKAGEINNIPGKTVSVEYHDNILYTGQTPSRISLYDVTDNSHPVFLRETESVDVPYDLKFAEINNNPYLFVASGEANLLVVDVDLTNPLNPMIKKEEDTRGISYGLALTNNFLFLANGNDGVKKYNVSDPLNPELLFSNTGVGEVRECAYHSGNLYLASGNAGMKILNGYNLENISYIETNGNVCSTDGKGSFGYLADSEKGFMTVDTGNSSQPFINALLPYDEAVKVLSSDNYIILLQRSKLNLIQVTP
ncbi:MAG: hypothetical protein CSB55_05960 [Candidatus Cloacimonadota bacterium]|nr:MAG: hypothetical protein CSB55_05960 [Candidatus Cloacimonadota bacterium]